MAVAPGRHRRARGPQHRGRRRRAHRRRPWPAVPPSGCGGPAGSR
jgi:hypothetical protein